MHTRVRSSMACSAWTRRRGPCRPATYIVQSRPQRVLRCRTPGQVSRGELTWVARAIPRCFDRSHNDHYEAIAAFPVRLYRLLHSRSWIFDLSVALGCPLDGGLKLRGELTALSGLECAKCRPPADPKFAIVSLARRAASAKKV